jgi:hypothetical protein
MALTPEELEVERLELSLRDDPEMTKWTFGVASKIIDVLIDEVAERPYLLTRDDFIEFLEHYRDSFGQINAL